MKKKILNLFVTTVSCITVLTLTGCTNPIKKQMEHKDALETASEQMTNLMADEGSQLNSISDTSDNLFDNAVSSDDGTIFINDVAEFDNGLAVLKDDKTYIIDENFNILWSYDEKYGDEYVDGYVKLNDVPEEGTITIYDKNGNQKFSYKKTQYQNVTLGSNGCLIITKKKDTYNSSSTTTGIYSLEKGEYILKPNEDYVGDIRDRGEGMYQVDKQYFNSKTEKLFKYGSGTTHLVEYIDGYAVTAGTEGITVFTTDGKMYKIPEPNGEVTGVREYQDNLVYDIYNNNIFNLSTKKVTSLKEFAKTNSDYCPVFSNGYALVRFLNEGNTPYYTVIDSTGKMMFEPVRLEDNNGTYITLVTKKIDSGYFIINVDNTDVVMDINNKEILRAEDGEEFEGITNNHIMARKGSQSYYKDMQGNVTNIHQQQSGE